MVSPSDAHGYGDARSFAPHIQMLSFSAQSALDLGLKSESELLECALSVLHHNKISLQSVSKPPTEAESLLSAYGLPWGRIVHVVDNGPFGRESSIIASVVSVDVRDGAHLPFVIPEPGSDGVGEAFREAVQKAAKRDFGFTVEDRFAEIDGERAERAAQFRRTRNAIGLYLIAGVSISIGTAAFVGSGPLVERLLRSQDEDPVIALNRHVADRGPRQVAMALQVDRLIQNDPDQARTFLSRLSPGHYDSLAKYAALGEISEPDALLLVQVLHRLAQLELSFEKASKEQPGARAAFERRFNLIFHDSPYREVRYEVADILKRL